MTERNISAEILDGRREIREHRAGRRTLRTTRVEPRPLPELTPEAIRGIRAGLDVSRAVFAHTNLHTPVRGHSRCPSERLRPPRHRSGCRPHAARRRGARHPLRQPLPAHAARAQRRRVVGIDCGAIADVLGNEALSVPTSGTTVHSHPKNLGIYRAQLSMNAETTKTSNVLLRCQRLVFVTLALTVSMVSAKDSVQVLDIQEQAANAALTEYARVTGRGVLFQFDLVSRYRTNEVVGEYGADQALRLLMGRYTWRPGGPLTSKPTPPVRAPAVLELDQERRGATG